MNKLISTKNRVFKALVGQSETSKLQPASYNWFKTGTLQPNFDRNFSSTPAANVRCYAKKN